MRMLDGLWNLGHYIVMNYFFLKHWPFYGVVVKRYICHCNHWSKPSGIAHTIEEQKGIQEGAQRYHYVVDAQFEADILLHVEGQEACFAYFYSY